MGAVVGKQDGDFVVVNNGVGAKTKSSENGKVKKKKENGKEKCKEIDKSKGKRKEKDEVDNGGDLGIIDDRGSASGLDSDSSDEDDLAGLSGGEEDVDGGFDENEYIKSIHIDNQIVKNDELQDNAMLERYVELEREIGGLERKNAQQTLALKQQQLQVLDAAVNRLEQRLNDPSYGREDDGVVSSESTGEAEGYSQQEAEQKELETVNKQRDIVEQEIQANKEFAGNLGELKRKRKRLLTSVFGKNNGSDEDYRLEFELDMLLERRQRIFAAKYRWQNAKLLVQHAISQLAFSVRKWRELRKTPPEEHDAKQPIVIRIRNNMIAAVLNLQSSQRYLSTITFPYCTPTELATLRKAIDTMFKDLEVKDQEQAQQLYRKLRAHAAELIGWIEEVKPEQGRPMTSINSWQKQVERYYQAALYRAVALKQWMQQVISTIIHRDLKTVSKRCSEIQSELRKERIRLIQAKTKTGVTLNPVPTHDLDDIYDVGEEPGASNDVIENEIANLLHSQDDAILPRDLTAPSPLPTPALAPPPSIKEIFDEVNQIHRNQGKFEEAMREQKVSQQKNLDKKIEMRKSQSYSKTIPSQA